MICDRPRPLSLTGQPVVSECSDECLSERSSACLDDFCFCSFVNKIDQLRMTILNFGLTFFILFTQTFILIIIVVSL